VETFLLNQITYQTALATKAARCRIAAPDTALFDFALRRTHGVEAGMAAARVCAIAGFAGTSNVEAARRFGLRPVGTMAHSYVQAFPTEVDAFTAFVQDFPGHTTFLVDTYDSLEGVEAAAAVIKRLGLAQSAAVRIDSGDLNQLARQARKVLDTSDLPGVQIFASGGLDEYDLERFHFEGTPIDSAGVGTLVGVSADAPSLDTVYKLVTLDGRPVMKLSTGKATLPGAKQIWRRHSVDGDFLTTRGAPGLDGAEPLLVPVMREGARQGPPDTIDAAHARLIRDLETLSPVALDLHEPVPPRVTVSPELRTLTDQAQRASLAARQGYGRRS
jgi:nicotinate phosphoribosyltransferase